MISRINPPPPKKERDFTERLTAMKWSAAVKRDNSKQNIRRGIFHNFRARWERFKVIHDTFNRFITEPAAPSNSPIFASFPLFFPHISCIFPSFSSLFPRMSANRTDRFPVRTRAGTYVHTGTEAALVSDKSKYFAGYESSWGGKNVCKTLGACIPICSLESYTCEPRAVQYLPFCLTPSCSLLTRACLCRVLTPFPPPEIYVSLRLPPSSL